MVRAADFQPDWASPPGRTITEIMAAKGISTTALARAIDAPQSLVGELTAGNVHIDRQMAHALERALGPSASFWLAREQQYRSDLARIATSNQAASARELISKLPVADMRRFGWIADVADKEHLLRTCLSFFGVERIEDWHSRYRDEIAVAAFRTSQTFESNSYAVAAWLRRAYSESERIKCRRWDAAALKQALPLMRALSRTKDPERFLPQLIAICASVGIALVIVQAPKGCRASGATRFLSPHKALVVLSFRYRSDDHFWFTFFHEIGHLVLHSHDALFIEDESGVTEAEEAEANEFAARILIPKVHEDALRNLRPGVKAIITFARTIGVSPGVVVGQLQHRGLVKRDRLNSLKRRYAWDGGPFPRLIP